MWQSASIVLGGVANSCIHMSNVPNGGNGYLTLYRVNDDHLVNDATIFASTACEGRADLVPEQVEAPVAVQEMVVVGTIMGSAATADTIVSQVP